MNQGTSLLLSIVFGIWVFSRAVTSRNISNDQGAEDVFASPNSSVEENIRNNTKPIFPGRNNQTCFLECKNGGRCRLQNMLHSTGNLGQESYVCECPSGFLGANCNILDACSRPNTCKKFGSEARCITDVSQHPPHELTVSPHLCVCKSQLNDWVACSELIPESSSAEIQTTAPPLTTISFVFTDGNETDSGPLHSVDMSLIDSTGSSDLVGRFSPPNMNSSDKFDAPPEVNTSFVEFEKNSTQNHLFTTMASTKEALPSHIESTIIPEAVTEGINDARSPGQRPPNVLSETNSTTTKTMETTHIPDNESEGDNGFTRVTQIFANELSGETSRAQFTTTESQSHISIVTSMEEMSSLDHSSTTETLHSITPTSSILHTEKNNDKIISPERSKASSSSDSVAQSLFEDNISIPPLPTTAEDLQPITKGTKNELKSDVVKAALITIGSIIIFLLVTVSVGGVCVSRFVKKSRQLHGKYNPAKEEGAVGSLHLHNIVSPIPQHNNAQKAFSGIEKDERLI